MGDPEEEIIKIFKQAIAQSPVGLRIRNLFGYLAPAQRKRLRQWFMRQFPNPADHIAFIHDNRHHFKYDVDTGIITVNREFISKTGATGKHGEAAPADQTGD